MENQYKNTPVTNTVFTPGQTVPGASYPSAQQSEIIQPTPLQQPANPVYEAPILPNENSLETLPPSTDAGGIAPIVTPNPSATLIPTKKPLINKAFLAISAAALIIVVGVAGIASVISSKNNSQLQSPSQSVNEQDLTLGTATPDVLSVLQLKGSQNKLIVNGDVIATGRISLASGNFYGQFVTNNLSANREYVLPDSSGTLCLDTNNCNFVASIGGTGGALTLGVGLSMQGNTIVNSQTATTVNGFNGNVVVQGTTNQINVANNAGTIILSAPQDIALSSSPTFQGLTLATTGTQGGNVLCDISNNCGYAGSSAFIQNGNSFGATAVLGTNDNNNLVFETNNISRVTLDTTGNVGISAVSNGAKLYVPYQTGDVGGVASGALFSGTATLVQVGDFTNINNNMIAIDGESYSGVGVQGISATGGGVVGISTGSSGASSAGVLGFNSVAGGMGVVGMGGVFGTGDGVGVYGYSGTNVGVFGQSANGVSGFFQSTCTGLFVCTGSSAQPTLITGQYSTSTADLFQAQNSGGAARFKIAYDGHTGIGNGNNAAVDDCTMLSALLSGPTCYSVLNIQESITDLTKGYTAGINNHILLSPSAGANVASNIQGINNIVATTANDANYGTVRGEITNLYHQGSGSISFGEAEHLTVMNAGSGSMVFAKGLQSDALNSGNGSITVATGVSANAVNTAGGTIGTATGLSAAAANTGAGSITTTYGIDVQTGASGAGSITTNYGMRIQSAYNVGAITTNYGAHIMVQTAGASDYGLRVDAADTQTLWLSGDADNTTASAGIVFGSSRDTNLYRSAANTLRTDGVLSVGTMGATDTSSGLCLNSSNQLAGCNTTGAGAAFVQFGNSFGATATLGTNDAQNLSFETAGTVRGTFDQSYGFYLGNGSIASSPQASTLAGTGGSGTDISGASLTISGGRGTGSAAGGSILFQTSAPGASSTTLRSLSTVLTLSGGTGIATFQNISDSSAGFVINDADGGTPILNVDTTNERVGIGNAAPGAALEVTGDIFLSKEAARTIKVADSTTASTAGGALALVAGAGSATTGGTGGAISMTGGAAQAGSGNGGAANITGGGSFGVATGGAVNITGGGGLTGGPVVINGGNGVTDGNIRMATTDGMVAIGSTTTPTAMLHVRGRLATTTTFIVDNLAIVGAIAEFKDNGTNVMQLADGGAALFQNAADSTTGFRVLDQDGGTSILNVDTTNERVGIGKDAPTVSLDVLSAGADGTTVAQFMNAGATSCTVQPGGTGFACASDARLKTNVATVINPLDTIKALRGVTFNWTSSPDGQNQVGFLAQELEQLIPSAVSESPNGYKVANYTAIIPYLVGAAQAQDLQISGLQEDTIALQDSQTNNSGSVTNLTNRVNTLEQRVTALEVASQGQGNSFASLNVSGPATIHNLTVTGAATIAQLTVTGNATFAGNITIGGHVLGNVDTRGTVTISAGQTEYKFTFVKPYTVGSQPNVVLTSKSAFAPSYRVESTDKDFTVYFLTPVASDVAMNYQVQE